MKKLIFVLMILTAALLCFSVAFAAGNCDACGSSDLTLIGSGAWCHWECNACGYRTSRNHNPNSYNSGLVPDSCSGKCSWCGAAAAFSSHTFSTWAPTGDATCTKDGTDTSFCANEQCTAKTTRPAPGSALGHDYVGTVTPPTCSEQGYTTFVCSRCNDTYKDEYRNALGHSYGEWVRSEDGTHTANCTRKGCYARQTAPCSMITSLVGGSTLTFCPICGYVSFETPAPSEGENAGETAPEETDPAPAPEAEQTVLGNLTVMDMDVSEHATAKSLSGKPLPGRLMVLVDAAPLEIPLQVDAFYLFLTAFQFGGKEVPCNGPVAVTIDLNEHPFVMADSIFFEMPVSELKARAFKIVRVEQELLNGEYVEVWHEMPFTLEKGVLTFETEKMGVFLMVLNITQAPSVG